MKKATRWIAVFALIVLIALLAYFASFSQKSNQSLLSSVIASVLVELTNDVRQDRNIGELNIDERLSLAAQMKAEDMARKGYFSHNSPDGKNPQYWFIQSGYNFEYAGENLAVNFDEEDEIIEAWLDSEGHRFNLLNEKFTEIGIGIAKGEYDGYETIYVVQLLGKPFFEDIQGF